MNLLTPQQHYIAEYPQAIEFAEEQNKILWFSSEIKVDKDVQDIRTELTPAERHGVLTTLKLFTKYELLVGDDYWQQLGSVLRKPACIGRMASTYQFVEKAVHSPFYNQINEALGLANESFYSEYINDPTLADRISFLEKHADPADLGKFLTVLALTEGAILYSSFAYLKHFQSNGKNKINNIVRGINFSVRK